MTVTNPTITIVQGTATGVEVDALVVAVQATGDSDQPIRLVFGADGVQTALGGSLLDSLRTLGAKGKKEEVTVLPSGGAITAPLVVAMGLGEGTPSPETVRRAAAVVLRRLDGQVESVAFAVGDDEDDEAVALAEGCLLGAYRFDRYRSSAKQDADSDGRRRLTSVSLVRPGAVSATVTEAIEQATVVSRAVNLARDWVNMPPADLYPESFADQAVAEANRVGAQATVLSPERLKADGYGGLVGVGQGSERGPRLVEFAYRPADPVATLAFVGKGITFDSGGLSLKPNDGMKTMKSDMGGAAAVLAAASAIAELKLPIAVTAWAALAENMPSGGAQRPSDVLTIYGGKTVEVLNTDAEGRLVLADGIVRASEDGPDVIIDVATLTGAALIALGDRVYGVMGDEETRSAVIQAAERAGEDAWPLPIPEGSREQLDSKVADLANVSSSRYAGALRAGAFLQEFVADGIGWAHLDIAGPAFNEGGAWGYTPSGGTGVAVRSLVEFARARAERS